MKFSACSRTGFALALTAAMVAVASPATAQEQGSSIFSNVSPSIRDRVIFRLDYVSANVKTTSGEARDVTGPVLTLNDVRQLGTGGSYTYSRQSTGLRNKYYRLSGGVPASTTVYAPLQTALAQDAAECESLNVGLGTPCGIRARGESTLGTPAISIGYYFDDDYSWMVEGFLLAAPLKAEIYGDGANGLNGVHILDTKLLPPIVILGKYFGAKGSMFRPFLGIAASYAMFFDAKATSDLNRYVGGASEGDTTVSIKNAYGFGPFVGWKMDVGGDWHINLSVGKLRYKTEATITTRNTVITDSSAVLQDYPIHVQNANSAGVGVLATGDGGNGIRNLMCDLAEAKYGNSNCNLGTFVRKQSTVLDNTLIVLGVGRSF